MMFKLLLLLPIILGPKCLVYSNDDNHTSLTSGVENGSSQQVSAPEVSTDETQESGDSTTPENGEPIATPVPESTAQPQGVLATPTNNNDVLEYYTLNLSNAKFEKDESFYKLITLKPNYVFIYKFNDNVKCGRVNHENTIVWSRDHDQTPMSENGEKDFPRKVSYNIRPKLIFVYFKERLLGYVFLNNKWDLKVIRDIAPKLDPTSPHYGLLNNLYPSGSAISNVHNKREGIKPLLTNLYPLGAATSDVHGKREQEKPAEEAGADQVVSEQPSEAPESIGQAVAEPAQEAPSQTPADQASGAGQFKVVVVSSPEASEADATKAAGEAPAEPAKQPAEAGEGTSGPIGNLYPEGAASSHVKDVAEGGEGTKEGTDPGDGSASTADGSGTAEQDSSVTTPASGEDQDGSTESDADSTAAVTVDADQAEDGTSSSTPSDPNEQSTTAPDASSEETDANAQAASVPEGLTETDGTSASAGTEAPESGPTSQDASGEGSTEGGDATAKQEKDESEDKKGTEPETGESHEEPTTITSKLKLFHEDPADPNNNIELEAYRFKKDAVNELPFLKHHFATDAKCTKVQFKDLLVWEFDPNNPNVYPKSVGWHESYYLVFLEFEDDYKYYRKFGNDNEWKSKNLKSVDKLDQSKIKLFTKEESDLKELEADQYNFKDLGFAYEYLINKQAKCHKLTYDGATIYAYDSNDDKGNYPSVLYVFSNRSGHVFYEKASYPLESPIDLELNLKSDTEGTRQFDYEKKDKVVTYTAKQGYGFSVVTTITGGKSCCGSSCSSCCSRKGTPVDIWLDANNTNYATKVVLEGKGNNKKTVTIHLDNGTKRVFKKNGRNKPWNEQQVPVSEDTVAEGTTPEAASTPSTDQDASGTTDDADQDLSGSSAPAEGSTTGADEGKEADGTTPVVAEGTTPEASGDDGTTKLKKGESGASAEADGTSGEDQDGSTGGDDSGSTVATTPEASSPPAEGAQESGEKEEDASGNGTSSGEQASTYAGQVASPKEALILDIKNAKKATPQFEYEKEGKVVTYMAKDNHGFNVVKQKNTEIWKTDNPNEYAEKVVMDGKGNNKKTVTIYLPGNKTKVFKKDGRNKPWKEEVQSEGEVTEGSKPKEETSSEQSGTQGTKESTESGSGSTSPESGGTTGTGESTDSDGTSGDGSGTTPPANQQPSNAQAGNAQKQSSTVSNNDYTIDLATAPEQAAEYDFKKDMDKIYTFKDNVKCTKVKYNNIEVWKKGDKEIENPKYVSYNDDDKQIVVSNDQKGVIYKMDNDGNWNYLTTSNY